MTYIPTIAKFFDLSFTRVDVVVGSEVDPDAARYIAAVEAAGGSVSDQQALADFAAFPNYA
jgi:hypothetical protein